MPTVAILAFPGTNCEYESLRACRAVGLDAELVRWNEAEKLKNAAAFFLAGGFSFQDRVRAGAIAAKEAVLEQVARAADSGKPVLGICNGAQVLLESGLVPGLTRGHPIEAALDSNSRGYLCRWTYLKIEQPERSLFTTAFESGEVIPVPIAHAEGRFTTADPTLLDRVEKDGQVTFRYVSADGSPANAYPDNPNGALNAIAGMSNPAGNVLALMPHPERATWLRQLPKNLPGVWGERRRGFTTADDPNLAGPGRKLFLSLARHLGVK